jgi:hypothetical protein
VDENNGERTLFVFFENRALDQGLKSGYVLGIRVAPASEMWDHPLTLDRLIALFELADITTFGCSQIVACVGRSEGTDATELVRSLGWCGFSLTTLKPWMSSDNQGTSVSEKWLFLVAEV